MSNFKVENILSMLIAEYVLIVWVVIPIVVKGFLIVGFSTGFLKINKEISVFFYFFFSLFSI